MPADALEEVLQKVALWSEKHVPSLSPASSRTVIPYGTAGFRDKAEILDSLVFRCGSISCLRSKSLRGSVVGLMITASHNPEEENGVKLVDPSGEMLHQDWEVFAQSFANAEPAELQSLLQTFLPVQQIDLKEQALVLIARDTRSSSRRLATAAADGVGCFSGEVIDLGLLTTPQLHFIVKCKNDRSYGEASEDGYYDKLLNAFRKLNAHSPEGGQRYDRFVCIDCANGVGALKMAKVRERISDLLTIRLENAGETAKLNDNCGADYVKLLQKAPNGMSLEVKTRYASFDGDADRIVYFYTCQSPGNASDLSFQLLDGDKIATLIALYLDKLLTASALRSKLTLCLIQSAYANGSSTIYAKEKLQIETDCVPTGVKHLHSRAKDFDVGVYFEANGHGTVLFSQKSVNLIRDAAASGVESALQLSALIDLINQTTGDAISDLLLIETILRNLDWCVTDWNDLYRDLPCRQVKVVVSDRSKVRTENAERRCTHPEGLQDSIDAHVRKLGPNARSFVRPSGTENVVRVYAEAETQEKADRLAEAVASAVKELVPCDDGDK